MPTVGKLYKALEILTAQEVPEYGFAYEERDTSKVLINGVNPYRFINPGTIMLYLGNREHMHWLLYDEKIYMYSGSGRIEQTNDFEYLWKMVENND